MPERSWSYAQVHDQAGSKVVDNFLAILPGLQTDVTRLIRILLPATQQLLAFGFDIATLKHTKPHEICQQNASIAFSILADLNCAYADRKIACKMGELLFLHSFYLWYKKGVCGYQHIVALQIGCLTVRMIGTAI